VSSHTLVDANVLLDLATDDPSWAAWSVRELNAARRRGGVAINQIVYAEVSIGFATREECDKAFPESELERLELPWEAAFVAGKAFVEYRRRGGSRQSALPDFYIGAHALVQGLRLLTRDASRYRTYFPGVLVIAPE
jgi:predicted nucleic acid-binding protein